MGAHVQASSPAAVARSSGGAILSLWCVAAAFGAYFCMFVNGLALGMVFGLVLGFLECRQQTEVLAAGPCASFILADGVGKSACVITAAAGGILMLFCWAYFTAWRPAEPLVKEQP